MASAGAGIDEAAGTTKRKKRISDCLADSDGGDELAMPPPSPPSPRTPRLRIPMFTCARLRFVRPGRKGGGGFGRKELAAEVEKSKSEAASTDSSAGWKAASSGASSTEAAGMGLSLLFLLAKTCVELNKMAEVRAQMEAFLQEMKDQLAARTTKASTTTTTASPCQCHASVGARTGGRGAGDGATSSSSPGPEPTRPRHFHRDKRVGRRRRDAPFYALTGNPLFDLDREPYCGRAAAASSSAMEIASETSSGVEHPACFMAVDVAGPQLQLSRDSEQVTPESSSDGESYIELEGGFGAGAAGRGGNGVWRRRDSEDSHEEEEEEEEGGGDEGVSAVELERRLQEVLHRRSRDRIEELEAALRRAERKVMEKEMEARLWKDTAKLALQPEKQHDGAGYARGGTGQ